MIIHTGEKPYVKYEAIIFDFDRSVPGGIRALTPWLHEAEPVGGGFAFLPSVGGEEDYVSLPVVPPPMKAWQDLPHKGTIERPQPWVSFTRAVQFKLRGRVMMIWARPPSNSSPFPYQAFF